MEDERVRGVAEGLTRYYEGLHPERVDQVITGIRDLTNGWEADIYAFTLEFTEGDSRKEEERVARLYHGGGVHNKAMNEFQVMKTLNGAGYPVPEVYHLETEGSALGGPFIIMEWIKGMNLSPALRTPKYDADALFSEFIRIWVQLHGLDGRSLIPDFPEGDTDVYLDMMLERGTARIEETGVSWLQPVVEWLRENKAEVTPEGLSILHQDYHTENVMVREDGSLVVLDWTGTMPGDFRSDLAWSMLLMSTYDDPNFRERILHAYEKEIGREITDIEFFDVLAVARRLLDVASTFAVGAEQMGMKAGAIESMRNSKDHYQKTYGLLVERTGIRLPEFEELLDSL